MARFFKDEWEGIEYKAKPKGKIFRLGRKWVYPYFVGDTIKIAVELKRVRDDARHFHECRLLEIVPEREAPFTVDLTPNLVKRYKEAGFLSYEGNDREIKFVRPIKVRRAGEVQFFFGRGRVDERPITRLLFRGEVQNNDQHILKFMIPLFSFFIGVFLPIFWDYIRWVYDYVINLLKAL